MYHVSSQGVDECIIIIMERIFLSNNLEFIYLLTFLLLLFLLFFFFSFFSFLFLFFFFFFNLLLFVCLNRPALKFNFFKQPGLLAVLCLNHP